jgi:hypothetical protein
MSLYFVSYDFRRSRSYQPFLDALKALKAVRVSENIWCLFRLNTTAQQLADYLMQLLDAYDGLMVTQVSDWASFNTDGHPNDLEQFQK